MVAHAPALDDRARPAGGEREVQPRARRAPVLDEHAGRLAADPGDVALDRLEQRAERLDLLAREVDEDGGVEDADERVRRRLGDQPRQRGQRVAAADLDRVLARDGERRREPLLAGRLVGPQARAQPARVGGVGGVDRRRGRRRPAMPPAADRAAARAGPTSSQSIVSGDEGTPAVRPP